MPNQNQPESTALPGHDRVFQLALAALLHDVGKPLQRAATAEESRGLAAEKDVFCPTDLKSQRKTHHHAAFTARFLDERLRRLVPQGAGDDNVVGWAARHHNPGSAWDHVVTEADRLSSGMDRGYTDESWGGWEQVVGMRLAPVLARVSPTGPRSSAGRPRFPLRRLALERAGLFPGGTDVAPAAAAVKEYKSLIEGFSADFDRLVSEPALDVAGTIRSALAVLGCHFWSVPAATNSGECDVSLFDHSRTAAALAASLAAGMFDAGHADGNAAWLKDRSEQRHALVIGDISGIQRYITGVARKGAAKSLRGRSFCIQLLTDAIAEGALRQLDLPASNVLYAGGGHFWILAPASRVHRLTGWSEEVDAWLLDWSAGALGFALGVQNCSGEKLAKKEMAGIREGAMRELHASRTRRLRGLATRRYEEVFGVIPVDPTARPCGACGKEFSTDEPEDADRLCPVCARAEAVGRVLPRAARLVRLRTGRHQVLLNLASRGGWLHFGGPLGVGYALQDEVAAITAPPGATVFDLGVALPVTRELEDVSVGIWPLGRNAPVDAGGEPLEYEDLAAKTAGVPTLGVLMMDVDNLGALFSNGFKAEEASVSRLASLSGHLTLFFSGRLGRLIEESDPWSDSVQIVYSGGDDILLVGAFDRLPGLAAAIRREFGDFCGGNESLSLSGGISHDRPELPVVTLVRHAQSAESDAKAHRHPDKREKDALSLIGVPLSWSELRVAAALARDLCVAVGGIAGPAFDAFGLAKPHGAAGSLPRSVLMRLLAIAQMEHKARRPAVGGYPIEGVKAAAQEGRWAWMAAYQLVRLAERRPDARQLVERVRAALATPAYGDEKGDRHLIEYLEVPVSWAFMSTRATSERKEDDR